MSEINYNNMSIESRGGYLYYIDLAKVVGAFLVVFAHMYTVVSPERLYIYAFHMPFFFYVSGLFFKPVCLLRELRITFSRLIIPAFIYIFIAFFIEIVFIDSISFRTLLEGSIKGLVLSGQIRANNLTWFLFCLANVRLFTNIWNKNKVTLGIIFIFILTIKFLYGYNFFFSVQSIVAFPFFLLGYYTKDMLNKEAYTERNAYTRMVISLLLLIGTILLTTINGRCDLLGLMFGNASHILKFILFYLNAMVGTLLLLNTSLIFKRNFIVISKTARALITILGLQSIFLYCYAMSFGANSSYLCSVPCSVLIIIACTLLHSPISKVFNKINKY